MRASPQYENVWLHSASLNSYLILHSLLICISFPKCSSSPLWKKWGLRSKGATVLDKVANISIILIFIQSVNESQEGMNRAALHGQSTRLLCSLPADEKLMRTNSVLPLYLNRFGTWQSQSHVGSGTASTWPWLACQSNPPLPRASKKAGCPFVPNWKKY